jgi:hypothetical protein
MLADLDDELLGSYTLAIQAKFDDALVVAGDAGDSLPIFVDPVNPRCGGVTVHVDATVWNTYVVLDNDHAIVSIELGTVVAVDFGQHFGQVFATQFVNLVVDSLPCFHKRHGLAANTSSLLEGVDATRSHGRVDRLLVDNRFVENLNLDSLVEQVLTRFVYVKVVTDDSVAQYLLDFHGPALTLAATPQVNEAENLTHFRVIQTV